MAKDKCPECKSGAPEWMATYGDLVTLLMCFFVLLFAFSNIDAQKFQAVMQSFQGSAGILEGGKSLSEAPYTFDGMPESQTSSQSMLEMEKLEDIQQKVEEYLEQNNMEDLVELKLETKGLVIRFKDNVLFDSGSANVKSESTGILRFLSDLLKTPELINHDIRVEGHTDNVPHVSSQYPSNWELSTARATNVVRFFVEQTQLLPSRLSASGYSEFHPIESNASPAGRSANRRVDIVVVAMEEVNTEDSGGN